MRCDGQTGRHNTAGIRPHGRKPGDGFEELGNGTQLGNGHVSILSFTQYDVNSS